MLEIKLNNFSKRGSKPGWVNSLRPRQNRRHFAGDVFKCNFLNENVWIPINISLKFVPDVSINNIPTLVQMMAWHRTLGLNESTKETAFAPALTSANCAIFKDIICSQWKLYVKDNFRVRIIEIYTTCLGVQVYYHHVITRGSIAPNDIWVDVFNSLDPRRCSGTLKYVVFKHCSFQKEISEIAKVSVNVPHRC